MSIPEESAGAGAGSCTYELDVQLRIVAVNEHWSQFAIANEAPQLAGSQLIGQSLLAHIADPGTAHLYEQLFSKVLRTQRSIIVPLRCDSSTLRRFLELKIEPRVPDGLRLRSRLLAVELRPAVRLLDPGAKRAGKAIRMCSFCKRVEAHGSWLEVEDALIALRLFERDAVPPITHGVCPSCLDYALKLLGE